MRKCQLSKCKKPFEPTAQHQKFHSDLCRFKHHQMQRQRLVQLARKMQKKEAAT